MAEKITNMDSVKVYESDMIKYSIIVNRRRAIPEIKDGLKVVQRRTLYDMFTQNATEDHKIKVAAITGDVQKLFHPHGTSSVYTAILTMGTWFKCKMPLIAPQGNWGNVAGDSAASERYIEAGLSDFCMDAVIGELKDSKWIVDWNENYLRNNYEPDYLPVKVPILLINGSFGLGLGMSTNLPPHNLAEVINETRAVLRDPNHRVYLIPDHCLPCEIIKTDFKQICDTGRGSYKVRGIVKIYEENGYPVLRVTSLPDNISATSVVHKLEDMILKKQLPMIKDINDQSGRNVDIIITLRKGSDPGYVKQVLYAKTGVQTSITVNFEAVDDVEPRRYDYTSYIKSFLENRTMVKFRWYCNKLKSNMTRYHQLIAYIKIIESGEIDNIIKMVKKQTTIDETALQEYLIEKLNITDLQAKFILDTNIKRLTKGHLKKYKEEAAKLEKEQKILRKAVTDNGVTIMQDIDAELEYIGAKYGAPRTCKVINSSSENVVPQGTFKIVVTEKNYVRKIPDTDKINIIRKDNPKFVLKVDNTENILLFDNKGRVFKLPVAKIPVTDKNSAGIDVRMLIKGLTADIIAVYYEPAIKKIIENKKRKHYLAIVTRDNLIKKMDMEDFSNVNLSGLIYSKMKDDSDQVVGIVVVPGDLDVIIYSKQKALRTSVNTIPLFKRNASGSKAMNTDTPIEGISVMYPDVQSIVVVTEKGRLNKFPVGSLSQKDRARNGNNVIKLDQGDSIFSMFGVNENDHLRVLTTNGPVDIPVANIRMRSTVAAGDKVPELKNAVIVRCDVIK